MFRFIIKDTWVMPFRVSLTLYTNKESRRPERAWLKYPLNKSMSNVSSLPYDYILQFWYAWAFPEVNIIVLALNIVDSPNLVFIPIVSGQFEQVLPNLISFDQSTVSSSLRKLVKPKKSEKHSRSFAWKLISKPSYIDFIIYLDTCDVWWNYRVIQPQNKNNSRTFLNEEKATCKTHNFYTLLLFFLIIIALLIAVIIYSYLIKYWAKQKHLLPFQFINNKLKI